MKYFKVFNNYFTLFWFCINALYGRSFYKKKIADKKLIRISSNFFCKVVEFYIKKIKIFD